MSVYNTPKKKMTKLKKNFTIDDWIWNSYINGTDNHSARINKLIILGGEAEIGNPEEQKRKLTYLANKIHLLENENMKLKLLVENLKEKFKSKKTIEVDVSHIELNEYQEKLFKECAIRIKEKPTTAKGNHDIFKNETGLDISFKEFNAMLKKIEENDKTKKEE